MQSFSQYLRCFTRKRLFATKTGSQESTSQESVVARTEPSSLGTNIVPQVVQLVLGDFQPGMTTSVLVNPAFKRDNKQATHVERTEDTIQFWFDSASSPVYQRVAKLVTEGKTSHDGIILPDDVKNLSFCGGGAVWIYNLERFRNHLQRTKQVTSGENQTNK